MKMFKSIQTMWKYSKVSRQSSEDSGSSADDEKPMLPNEETEELDEEEPTRNAFNAKQFTIGALFGSFLSISLLLILLVILWHTKLDGLCLQRQSSFSPALRDIDPKYETVRFNGTLEHPSEYRGPPSPEIDRAWDRLENVRVMSISEEDLVKAGFTLDSAKLPEEYGGGYMASIEVNHQLHCLNFLRKALNWDYYQYKSAEFTDTPDMVHTHLNHCIEMLRQTLMCHSDVGVMAHQWVDHYSNPYPDFNVLHKCRNFEEVLQWTYDKQIPVLPEGFRWHAQEGEKIWPTPP